MKSRTRVSLPSLVSVVDGHGALEHVAAACEDVLAKHPPSARSEVSHVMLAGGAGAGRDIAALLPNRLGLRDGVTCSLAPGESGAAALAVLRMADACCRTSASARALVACVGSSQRETEELPPAAAALVSGLDCDVGAPALKLQRLAAWSHREETGEMTLTQDGDSFDLEASRYLVGDDVDLATFLRDHLDVDAKRAAQAAWAIHASATSASTRVRSPGLEDVRLALALGEDALAASRSALAAHGQRAASGLWQALRLAMEGDANEIIALGIGPGPTIEAARLRRA